MGKQHPVTATQGGGPGPPPAASDPRGVRPAKELLTAGKKFYTYLSQTGGVPVSHAASVNSCAGEGGRLVTKEWDESPGSPPRGVRAPHCIGVRV